MSLVEKAIKKLQDSRQGVPPSANDGLVAAADASEMRLAPVVTAPAVAPATPQRVRKAIAVRRNVLRTAGLLAPEHQEREIADQYRQIKRPLLAAITGRGGEKREDGHLIMVASALPGEGKTFTSVNLAMSMAMEKDINVLLVDADTPKPHITHIFGLEKQPGLLDALADPALDVEGLVVDTDLPRLSLLSVGTHMEGATELLASSHMQRVVARMASADSRRVVIFDSPPLLLTQESRVLAEAAGQIVLVVRAGETLQKAVADAISHLNPEKAIGLVLNQSDATPSDGYYYGMPGYGERPVDGAETKD
jgi:protein-tyrosine kinase